MESAATLANSLHDLLHNSGDKTGFDDVSKALEQYHQHRKDRTRLIVEESNNFTRHEALRSWKHRFLTLYFIPYAGDWIADQWSNLIVGATKLDFLPRPKRSLGVNMPFGTEHGIGKGDVLWRRAVVALPLLAFCYAANSVLNSTLAGVGPYLEKALASGLIEEPFGTVSVRSVFTGFAPLDDFVAIFVTAFTPSMAGLDHGKIPHPADSSSPITDFPGSSVISSGYVDNLLAPQRLQMISFMADILPISTIWMIESLRRGSAMTIVTLFVLLTRAISLTPLTLCKANPVRGLLSAQRNWAHSPSLLLPPLHIPSTI